MAWLSAFLHRCLVALKKEAIDLRWVCVTFIATSAILSDIVYGGGSSFLVLES